MIKKLIVGLALLAGTAAFGQAGFLSDRAEGYGSGRSITALPGAVITLCVDSACQQSAPMFTDQTMLSTNQVSNVSADTFGNFSFYATPGFYYCQVAAVNYTTYIYPCLVNSISAGGTNGAPSTGSGSTVRQNNPTINSPIITNGATVDTLNLSGNANIGTSSMFLSPITGNIDLFGKITLSGGTGSYTFQGTYSTAPVCQVIDPANHTLAFTTTTTTLSITGGTGSDVVNYHCLGSSVAIPMVITTATPLPQATHGVAYSTQLTVSGGVPPYSWTVPATTIPGGAIDVLDYLVMPLPDRNNFHMVSSANTPKYFHLDAGLLWWIKGPTGNPWDGLTVSATCVSQWFTENIWSNASSYKMYDTPICLYPRYFVPGTNITTSTAGPNKYKTTTNCGVDNLAEIDNQDVQGNIQGPFTDITWRTTYGGDIPDNTAYLLLSKYTKGTGGVYQSREQYWAVLGYGQVRWCPATWNGTIYVNGTCSISTTKVAGGSPVPNFACKVPTIPVTNNLPAGVLTTTGPSLNLDNVLGKITGTPLTAGNKTVTVQVEDAAGNIAQKTVVVPVN
jgi:hypothetical protein